MSNNQVIASLISSTAKMYGKTIVDSGLKVVSTLKKAERDKVEGATADNSQADGVKKLKRIEFEYGNQSFKFLINPEEFVQTEPSRATITQTKGGAYLDAWGAGLTTIEIKGTTGFRSGTNSNNKGFEQFVALRTLIRTVYDTVVPGVKAETLMKFYNYTDDDCWYVYPLSFTLTRSKTKPLLYNYNITLQGLARIGDYNPTDITQPKSITGEVNPVTPNQIVKDKIEPPAAEENEDSKKEETHGGSSGTFESITSKAVDIVKDTVSSCLSTGKWLSENLLKNPAYNIPFIFFPKSKKSVNRLFAFKQLVDETKYEATAELQTGVEYTYNEDITSYVISSIGTLSENFKSILGGDIGKISPVIAKFITNNLTVLSNSSVANIHCSLLLTDGFKDIGFINKMSQVEYETYLKLKSFDSSIIEVDSYYSYINDYYYVTKNNIYKDVSYNTLISVLLSKNKELVDSYLIQAIMSNNINLNYLLMLKKILISAVSIYSEIKNFLETHEKTNFSTYDLDIIINNIRYISRAFENYEPEDRPFYLIQYLRKLEVAVINFRGTQALFNNSSVRLN